MREESQTSKDAPQRQLMKGRQGAEEKPEEKPRGCAPSTGCPLYHTTRCICLLSISHIALSFLLLAKGQARLSSVWASYLSEP